jgi:predicted amidohydrolase
MRAGFYQSDVRPGERTANLDCVAGALGDARFDLVVLTELFATGYLFASRGAAAALAEPVPGGLTTGALADIARARQAFLVGSLIEADGDRLYNTAVVVGPHGFIGRHRKVHLPEVERRFFDSGDEASDLFDLGGVRIGLVICFESWFPEVSRHLALSGADILCHPANFGGTMSPAVIRTRAIENMVFTITANRIGAEGDAEQAATFRGESLVVDPEGAILLQAGAEEQLGLVEIDPPRARRKSSVVCRDLRSEIARARRTLPV